jgi:hypothetical protein
MSNPHTELEQLRTAAQPSLMRELLEFVVTNRKWWMIPFLAVLGLVSLLVLAAGSGAAPFIYTIF